MATFSDRLKALRARKGKSQRALAEDLNLSKSAISMYESGTREPDHETTEKIADYFNVDVDYLLGRSNVTSERVLHMRPELLAVVRSQLIHQKQICLAFGVRSPLLFPWMDGGHMHYEAYAKYFREHVRKIRGSALSIHSLRHTYTSLMAEAGVPIETISRQLGHADSSITKQIYMHVTDKVREADNRRLDAVQIL